MDNHKAILNDLPAVIVDASEVNEDSLAKANLKKSPDLMYVDYVLCHANVNGNKDAFTADNLQDRHTSIRLKPIDWEHTDVIIGVNYDSLFIDKPENVPTAFASLKNDFSPFVLVKGVVYKSKFPAYASIIEARHKAGILKYSMEVLFGSAKCSICGNQFEKSVDYCKHLNDRFTKGSNAFRELHDITFMGAGVVKNPADKDAVSFALAELITNAGQLQDNIKNESLIVAMRKVIDTAVSIVSGIVWNTNLTAEERISKLDDVFGDLKIFIQDADNFIEKNHMLTAPSSCYATKAEGNTTQGGKAIMAYKTFETEADFTAFRQSLVDDLTKALNETKAVQDLKNSNTGLTENIASLQKQLEDKNKEVLALKTQIDDNAKAALVEKRISVLKNAGVNFDENQKKAFAAELSTWADDKFELFVQMQKASNADNKENKDNKTVNATQVEPDLKDNKAQATTDQNNQTPNGYNREAFKGGLNRLKQQAQIA